MKTVKYFSVLALFTVTLACSHLRAVEKPNIILFLVDDQSWVGTSVQMNPYDPETKSDFFETPALEAMAASGMRFTDAYSAAPVCCPSRTALEFGQTAARTRVTFNARNNSTGPGQSIAQTLAPAGYVCGRYGKTGVDHISADELGYTENRAWKGNTAGDYEDVPVGSHISANKKLLPPDNPKRTPEITRCGIEFLERRAEDNQPFFLYLSYFAVHVASQATPETIAKYKAKKPGVKHTDIVYAAMTEELDNALAEVRTKLRELGLDRNTILIYTSDNGGQLMGRNHTTSGKEWETLNLPLSGWKATLDEGGIRVPFLVEGPGIASGTLSTVPVSGCDLLPTIADIAGAEPADDVDGGSLLPVLRNGGRGDVKRVNAPGLVWHQPWRVKNYPSSSALRIGDWKYLRKWNESVGHLYNVASDYREQHDLVAQFPGRAAAMQAELDDYLDKVNAEPALPERWGSPFLEKKGIPLVDPMKDAVKVWNFDNNAGMKVAGAVKTGVRLEGGEPVRESDGLIARFDDGWLTTGESTQKKLNAIDDYGFSLHVRLQIPDGQWDKPVITKGGTNKEFAWRLYGVPFGRDPQREDWEFTRQNYLSYGDSEGRGYALEFELGVQPEALYLENLRKRHENMRKRDPGLGEFRPPPDISNGIFRVGVPVSMIGPGVWHDVTVRFSGAKLELFVDGVLVDEEWPIGKIRISSAPCLIGAVDNGKEITGGFTGSMDHAAIWDRALSDEEISQLCGGPEKVAQAERRILGPAQSSLQYWRPHGHNAWVGDVMPVFDEKNGRFHLFYLFDRRHHQSKWGAGAHQFAHASSTDLVHWDHHPLAVPITRQTVTYGTGCPVILDDHIEVHYGMHTFRLLPRESTTQSRYEVNLKDSGRYIPFPFENPDEMFGNQYVPVGHGVAVSSDDIHFLEVNMNLTPSQNMWIYREPESGLYYMHWVSTLLTSQDLREWTPVDKSFLPTGEQSVSNNSGECPNYFEWNGWHYILMGRSGFWMSRDVNGPYWEGPEGQFKVKVVNPRWDIYDGLMVPMVASFKDNRRLLAGFNWSPMPYQNWAGYLVFRELIQYEDGTLGMKWPEEMIPPTREPLSWKISSTGKAVSTPAAGEVQLKGNGFTTAEIPGLPQSYRFTATIVPTKKATAFGINIKGESGYKGGCELRMEPAGMHAQWSGPANGGPAPFIPHIKDASSPQAPHWGDDFALENVEGLDGPFQLDVIVKYDPTSKVTLADACINGNRTMITHRYGLNGSSLYLFSTGGEVTFRDVSIRPLMTAGNFQQQY